MCTCMAGVNEKLKESNTKLSVSFCLTRDLGGMDVLPMIQTEKRDPKTRGKVITVVPTFCPFCGTKYPRQDDVTEVEAPRPIDPQ